MGEARQGSLFHGARPHHSIETALRSTLVWAPGRSAGQEGVRAAAGRAGHALRARGPGAARAPSARRPYKARAAPPQKTLRVMVGFTRAAGRLTAAARRPRHEQGHRGAAPRARARSMRARRGCSGARRRLSSCSARPAAARRGGGRGRSVGGRVRRLRESGARPRPEPLQTPPSPFQPTPAPPAPPSGTTRARRGAHCRASCPSASRPGTCRRARAARRARCLWVFWVRGRGRGWSLAEDGEFGRWQRTGRLGVRAVEARPGGLGSFSERGPKARAPLPRPRTAPKQPPLRAAPTCEPGLGREPRQHALRRLRRRRRRGAVLLQRARAARHAGVGAVREVGGLAVLGAEGVGELARLVPPKAWRARARGWGRGRGRGRVRRSWGGDTAQRGRARRAGSALCDPERPAPARRPLPQACSALPSPAAAPPAGAPSR
jgi:hypothetical protein